MSAPHQHTGAALRLLRAAVFAAVCVVLAAAGHAMAACAAIPLWTLGAGFLGVLAVAAPLAGRVRSLPGIVALLTVGQAVLHTLFGLGQHSAATTQPMSSMPTDATLVEQAARLLCGTTTAAISPAQAVRILTEARLYKGTHGHGAMDTMSTTTSSTDSTAALLPSLPMVLGHVLAAVAAGWLLRHGDLALLRLAELSAHGVAEGALVRSLRGALALVRALRAGLPGAPEAGPRAPRTERLAPPEPRTTALRHAVIRRGPPAADVLVLAA
ncbi:hypothetical protein [Streptomyces sp. S.PB5]|uniref:hypothetical protein n=1 Tax=Streptomyces sp. S.PB5 TaxID=3020844 RepID=UPI0025B1E5CC|nr:hypothetical protein [Streptomyces sp. S.PB5]MDN3023786.1 hypothetical protein [Streptomyces sp. S.PB5]